ncbi:MAG: transporter substrate-binding domain-containing protein [Gammaproteobacteria bacterium]|jgi:polar amino acid transport system substrate-binding protein
MVRLLRPYRLVCFSLLWLFISAPSSFAETAITLNAGTAEPFITADGGGFYGELTQEIFTRLGIDAKVIRLPSARSIINANEGIDDGVIGRIAGMERKYQNLIMIPIPVVTFKFVAYSRDNQILVKDWDSFKPYSVGYIRGWRIYEKNLPKTKSITIVNNAEQLFRLLMNGRAELIMFEYYRGTWWNEHLNANAHIIGSPVAEKDMYMYMHTKYKDLVPKITEAFKAMKQDGTYQKIKDKTLPKYIK